MINLVMINVESYIIQLSKPSLYQACILSINGPIILINFRLY